MTSVNLAFLLKHVLTDAKATCDAARRPRRTPLAACQQGRPSAWGGGTATVPLCPLRARETAGRGQRGRRAVRRPGERPADPPREGDVWRPAWARKTLNVTRTGNGNMNATPERKSPGRFPATDPKYDRGLSLGRVNVPPGGSAPLLLLSVYFPESYSRSRGRKSRDGAALEWAGAGLPRSCEGSLQHGAFAVDAEKGSPWPLG